MPYFFPVFKDIAKTILPKKIYERLRTIYWQQFAPGANSKSPQALQFGVNLFYYKANNSAGMEGHLLQSALNAAGIPYQTIDLMHPEIFNNGENGKLIYKVNLIVLHAASGTPNRMQLFDIDFTQYYNIGYWAWELPEVPDSYCIGIEMFQEIWTISAFCTKALEKKAKIPVLTVPNCCNPDRDIIPKGREYFHFDKNAFLFMFAYDCNSFVERKNPQAVVQAFMKAFSPKDINVGLVLKLIYSESHKDHIEGLLKILSPYRNIYYINQFLSDKEMRTLIYTTDAFISLHRSEGLGLLPMEAMEMGTPVIATEWSGNMEYMNHMNTALVGYTMQPVNGQYIGSTPGDGITWAEPNIDEAAELMRRMAFDKKWRDKLIENGHYTADNCYDANSIGKIMRDRLGVLGFNSEEGTI